MPAVLDTLHHVVVLFFVVVTFALMGVTIANRVRIRRVLLCWNTGVLFGLPLLPTLFIAVALPAFGYSLFAESSHRLLNPLLLSGYLCGGVFWYVGAFLAQSFVVTDFGLIRNVNRVGHAIAWGQIEDYFIDTCNTPYYVFLYTNRKGNRQRLELNVPESYFVRFRQIVTDKVDARFEFTLRRTYGKATRMGSQGS